MAQKASSSRTNDQNSLEYEELNKEQRCKASMYYGIKRISKEVEEEMNVRISPDVLATVCESLVRQAEIYAVDLELFAKHGKRTNINVEDVKLLARRNEQLLDHLNSIATEHASEKQATKKPRKGSNKARTDKEKSGPKTGSKNRDPGHAEPMSVDED